MATSPAGHRRQDWQDWHEAGWPTDGETPSLGLCTHAGALHGTGGAGL